MTGEPIRPPCPECQGYDVFKLHGPVHVDAWNFEQRYLCRGCGCRFIVWWNGEFLRTYQRRGNNGQES